MKIEILVFIAFVIIFILIFLSNTTGGWNNSLLFCGILFGMYRFGRFIQKLIDNDKFQ